MTRWRSFWRLYIILLGELVVYLRLANHLISHISNLTLPSGELCMLHLPFPLSYMHTHTSWKIRGTVADGSLFWSACSRTVRGTPLKAFSADKDGKRRRRTRGGGGKAEKIKTASSLDDEVMHDCLSNRKLTNCRYTLLLDMQVHTHKQWEVMIHMQESCMVRTEPGVLRKIHVHWNSINAAVRRFCAGVRVHLTCCSTICSRTIERGREERGREEKRERGEEERGREERGREERGERERGREGERGEGERGEEREERGGEREGKKETAVSRTSTSYHQSQQQMLLKSPLIKKSVAWHMPHSQQQTQPTTNTANNKHSQQQTQPTKNTDTANNKHRHSQQQTQTQPTTNTANNKSVPAAEVLHNDL